MNTGPQECQVDIARLVRVRPNFIEVHYVPGCVLSTKALQEVRLARQQLMGNTPYGMLSMIPEDVDFELAAMNQDHLADDRKEGLLHAIAVVTRANMIEMVLKLYFSYYPQLHRIRVTADEKEARAWLEKELTELARTGS